MTLSGEPYTIVGVLPQEVQFAPRGTPEFWTPLDAESECRPAAKLPQSVRRGAAEGRRIAGAAQADLQGIARNWRRSIRDRIAGRARRRMPLTEVIVGDIRPILLVLLGGAGLLLLIACVNVSSLLLVRAESRRREMAVRSALGASRMRLSRQFVTEGLVLVAVGSVLGLVLALWAMQAAEPADPGGHDGADAVPRGLGLNLRVCWRLRWRLRWWRRCCLR